MQTFEQRTARQRDLEDELRRNIAAETEIQGKFIDSRAERWRNGSSAFEAPDDKRKPFGAME